MSFRRWWFLILVTAYALIQAGALGISDDEAYYWVLARSPAWGYVYHPPMIAWVIAGFEKVLGWLPLSREMLLRSAGLCFFFGTALLARSWTIKVTGEKSQHESIEYAWLIVPGLAALSWMMVPDHPLIFGWMLCFYACWNVVRRPDPRARDQLLLAAGAAIGILSKFSAILYCASAAICILVFSRRKIEPLAALSMGVTLGIVPILLWNSQNEWAAILYQFQSRHSGATLDFKRYGLFWTSQLLFVGPVLLFWSLTFLARFVTRWSLTARTEKFLLFWFLPAAIFWVQPAFSAFKPHWAMVTWLPLGLAAAIQLRRGHWLSQAQKIFSVFLLTLTFLASHFPVSSAFHLWWTGKPANPLWDLSNDLHGWHALPQFLSDQGIPTDTPVIGSRYQTASQAAFALWPSRLATLAPKTRPESLEWPRLDEALEDRGAGQWPSLRRPVLFVGDDRYSQGPGFAHSQCQKSGSLGQDRYGMPSKKILLWHCFPTPP